VGHSDYPGRGGPLTAAAFSPAELNRSATFYVAGHLGLVGSAMVRKLQASGFTNVVGRSSTELDLRDRDAVFDYLAEIKPRYVVLAAAKVGGIVANDTFPVSFHSDNIRIQVNVLDAACAAGVERLMVVGSSCIYPKFADQPIREEALLTGALEPTNDAFAIAKIAGIYHLNAVRRQYGLPWIAVMATSLYGPNDNFSPTESHLLPALIRRYDDAKRTGAPSVTNWGSGSPLREFLHVDDLADACLYLLEHYDAPGHINVGTGTDLTIREISQIVASVIGYSGATEWDANKPDGTPRKLLDVSRLAEAGWTSHISLREGLEQTVAWYYDNVDTVRGS
jgi:GDP-L-fucose synthase